MFTLSSILLLSTTANLTNLLLYLYKLLWLIDYTNLKALNVTLSIVFRLREEEEEGSRLCVESLIFRLNSITRNLMN